MIGLICYKLSTARFKHHNAWLNSNYNDDDDACDLGDGQQGQGCYARRLQRQMA